MHLNMLFLLHRIPFHSVTSNSHSSFKTAQLTSCGKPSLSTRTATPAPLICLSSGFCAIFFKNLITFLSPWFSIWSTCSFSQIPCESPKSNLILRAQGLAHWKHSKILCWMHECRTCYFAIRSWFSGAALCVEHSPLGGSVVQWESSASWARTPARVSSDTFYVPAGPRSVLRHQQNRQNEKNFPTGFSWGWKIIEVDLGKVPSILEVYFS